MDVDNHPSTHPPLPPTTEDERLAWLRLLRSRKVGPVGFHRLIAAHGSASAALSYLPQIAREAGISGYAPATLAAAREELTRGIRLGANLVFHGSPDYPQLMSHLPDAPPFLWIMGRAEVLRRPIISIVGARSSSSLGQRMARELAADLAEAGFIIASGLARGIDTAAHQASLDRGTIAVMAGGIDMIYPAENRDLAHRITDHGVRITEQPAGLSPTARHFPMRNRLISGLARAVIVVEAAARSGSLITARNALEQGRDVMAVPGHPVDPRAAGCNSLLRDGATLVRNAADVIEALGCYEPAPAMMPTTSPQESSPGQAPPPSETRARTPADPEKTLRDLNALHNQILARLGPSPIGEDELIRDLAAPAQTVSPILTDLELEGRIERHPGGKISIIS